MTTDELRAAVDHDRCTVLERALQQRCGECGIDDEPCPDRAGDVADRSEIGNVERRIRRRLGPHQVGACSCRGDGSRFGDVDRSQLDVTLILVFRQQRSETEVAVRRYDDHLRCERVHGCSRSGHPARECNRAAALEFAYGCLERDPGLRAVGPCVFSTVSEVRGEHDRLVERRAVLSRSSSRDRDGSRRQQAVRV